MKNSIFARFARAFFIVWHFADVLVLSTTWNHLFCSCVDDVSIWWQMFKFVLLCPKSWFQFNSRIVKTHFSSMMTLNNLDCRSAKLHFQMTFSLPSTSCLLKLPNITVNKLKGSSVLQGRPPKRWHFYLVSFFNFHFMFAQPTQLNNGSEKLQEISITPLFLESKFSFEFPPLNSTHNQVLFVGLQYWRV